MKPTNLLIAAILMLAVSATATVFADDDAGYNTSNGDSVTIGSDQNTGAATTEDSNATQSIQDQTQDMKERWSGDAQRDAVENGTSTDSTGQ
jgi:hypothetical protein